LSTDNTIVGQDVHVRPARPADFEQLHAVDVLVFGELAYPYFALRQLFDAFPDCWLVAGRSTGLIGYSVGLPTVDRADAWLFGLAVIPGHRNQGYGRRLTMESLKLLAAMNVESVHLTVEPANRTAIRLYQEFEFVETEQRQDYFGPGEDRIVMTRQLQPRAPAGDWPSRPGVMPTQRPGSVS
jgi:ribosomal protein S18 acetylase RimI-like enzyme